MQILKNNKKILSLLILISIIASVVPVSAKSNREEVNKIITEELLETSESIIGEEQLPDNLEENKLLENLKDNKIEENELLENLEDNKIEENELLENLEDDKTEGNELSKTPGGNTEGEPLIEEGQKLEILDDEIDLIYNDTNSTRNVNSEEELNKALEDENVDHIIIEKDIEIETKKNIDREIIIEGKKEEKIKLKVAKGIRHFYIDTEEKVIFKNLVLENETKEIGGGIESLVSNNDNDIEIEDVDFINNKTDDDGGAILNKGTLFIHGDGKFINNKAEYNGGAINSIGKLTISGNIEFENNSSNFGGAIFLNNSGVRNEIYPETIIKGKITFINNEAEYNGGAILNKGKLYLKEDIDFEGNTAGRSGGAIYSLTDYDYFEETENLSLEIDGAVNFFNNKSEYDGGAISAGKIVKLDGEINFIGNESSYGAAISIRPDMAVPQRKRMNMEKIDSKTNDINNKLILNGKINFSKNKKLEENHEYDNPVGVVAVESTDISGNGNIRFSDNTTVALLIENWEVVGASLDFSKIEGLYFNNNSGEKIDEIIVKDILVDSSVNIDLTNTTFEETNDTNIAIENNRFEDIHYRSSIIEDIGTSGLKVRDSVVKDSDNFVYFFDTSYYNSGIQYFLDIDNIVMDSENFEILKLYNEKGELNRSIEEIEEDKKMSLDLKNSYIESENLKLVDQENIYLNMYNNTIKTENIDILNNQGGLVHNTIWADNLNIENRNLLSVNNLFLVENLTIENEKIDFETLHTYKNEKILLEDLLNTSLLDKEEIENTICINLQREIENIRNISEYEIFNLLENNIYTKEDELYEYITNKEEIENQIENINNIFRYGPEIDDPVNLEEVENYYNDINTKIEKAIKDLIDEIEIKNLISTEDKENVMNIINEIKEILIRTNKIVKSINTYYLMNSHLYSYNPTKETLESLLKDLSEYNNALEKDYKIDLIEKIENNINNLEELVVNKEISTKNILISNKNKELLDKTILDKLKTDDKNIGYPDNKENKKYFDPIKDSLAYGFTPLSNLPYNLNKDMIGRKRLNKVTMGAIEEDKEEKYYTVYFNSNGGTEVNSETVKEGETVSEPKDPTKSRYTFKGWYKDKDLEDRYSFNTRVYNNFTLYAKWSYNGSGGGGGGSSDRPKKPEKEEEPKKEEKLDRINHFEYIQGYPDNTIKAQNNITREEVAAVFYRLLEETYKSKIYTTKQGYKDFKEDKWSLKHVATLSNAKILTGYEDNTFRPGNNMTRAEVAAVASRFDNLSPSNHNFTDVKGHWAEKYIGSAAAKGWIKGYEDNTFRPDQPITRAEFVTLVNSVLDRKVEKENILEGIKEFKDLSEDKWYYEEFVEAINGHLYEKHNGKEIWLELKQFNKDM